jgi:hypothetical protein
MDALPPELLAQVLANSTPRTALAARRASSQLRGLGAEAIAELRAHDAELPPRAWQVFPHATRLSTSSSGRDANVRRYLSRLLALCASLPPRVEQISIADASIWGMPRWATVEHRALARGLVASACSASLQRLDMQQLTSTTAADILMSSLPRLRRLALNVCQELPPEDATARSLLQREHQVPPHFLPPPEPVVWRPQAARGSQLAELSLSCTADVLLDLSGLGCAAGLRRLSLSNCSVVCPDGIAGLGALRQLVVYDPHPAALLCDMPGEPRPALCRRCWRPGPQRQGSLPCCGWRRPAPSSAARVLESPAAAPIRAAGFAALSELRELEMCCTPCSEAGWRALASLPKLQSVLLGGLALGEAPPSGVTRLQLAGEPLALPLPRAALPGCLARQLPRLQELRAGACELQQLCLALRGHPALRVLEAAGGAGGGAPWPRGLLASLPALAELRLHARAGDELLADVGACGALTSLGLVLAGSSPAGRAALGAARCAPLLRELQLEDPERPLSAAEAAALLGGGGLPRLARAQLALQLPPAAAAAAASPQVATQLVEELLRREALPRGLACSCSWSSLPRQHRASGGWYASCKLELEKPRAG